MINLNNFMLENTRLNSAVPSSIVLNNTPQKNTVFKKSALKKSRFLVALFLLFILLLTTSSVFAASKECPVKLDYDIFIDKFNVQLINKQNNLIITPIGDIMLKGQPLTLTPAMQQEAKNFQIYLRKELPNFAQQAHWQLENIKQVFSQAISSRLDNNSELLEHLDKLHQKLVKLLNKSIITNNDGTLFYHQNFNTIRADGKALGESAFYNILGDSMLNFNVVKNYYAIKKIAKNEWKAQKGNLKAFDQQICSLVTNIDSQYNHVMQQLIKH